MRVGLLRVFQISSGIKLDKYYPADYMPPGLFLLSYQFGYLLFPSVGAKPELRL